MPAENQQDESGRSPGTTASGRRLCLFIHISCALGLMVIGAMGLARSGGHHKSDLWIDSYLSDIALCLRVGFVWGAFALDRAVRRVKPGTRRLVAIVGAALLLLGWMVASIAGAMQVCGSP